MDNLTIAVALGAGLLSFLSPCVLPLVPGYLSALSSVEAGRLGDAPGNPVQQHPGEQPFDRDRVGRDQKSEEAGLGAAAQLGDAGDPNPVAAVSQDAGKFESGNGGGWDSVFLLKRARARGNCHGAAGSTSNAQNSGLPPLLNFLPQILGVVAKHIA